MTAEEIYCQFLKTHKRILHLGSANSKIKNLINPDYYVGIDILPGSEICCDLNKDHDQIPEGFDYVLIAGVLEHVDDPCNLINSVKEKGKITLIYEYKYEDTNKDGWKNPWKSIGLESFLTREFDYVNSIFLGYATIHLCEMPRIPREEVDAG